MRFTHSDSCVIFANAFISWINYFLVLGAVNILIFLFQKTRPEQLHIQVSFVYKIVYKTVYKTVYMTVYKTVYKTEYMTVYETVYKSVYI